MRFCLDIPLTVRSVTEASRGRSLSDIADIPITAVSTDSRECERGDLFAALCKDPSKAVLHVKDAKARGALTLGEPFVSADITVNDSVRAFLFLAEYYKGLINPKATVAVTGSCGKTTTKEISLSLLGTKYKCHATRGNYNSEIGVPITVLTAPKDTELMIVEAGMNHAGELGRISECIKPDISVITNVGRAHIGNLGSRENIALAKLEILSGMSSPFLIAPHGEALLERIPRRTVSTSDPSADYFIKEVRSTEVGTLFDFSSRELCFDGIEFPYRGAHIAPCLGFSLALCALFGMNEAEVRNAARATSSLSRSQLLTIGGLSIIDDSYNCSPEALECALCTLSSYEKGIRSALLGDMLELGEQSAALHREAGRLCASFGIDKLFAFGKFSLELASGAIEGGIPKDRIYITEDTEAHEECADQIIRNRETDEVLLVKGSHGVGLDRIISILRERIGE